MLGSSFVSRISVWKSGSGKRGLKLICRELKQIKSNAANFSSFYSKALTLRPPKQMSVNCLYNAGEYFLYRCNTAQASTTMNENDRQSKSYFQELWFTRKKQAHRSILLVISNKEDIPYALDKCEKFGNVANAYSYSGESKNCFLLIEFSDEYAAQKLLSNCQFKNITDSFTVYSRLIQFEKNSNASLPQVNIKIHEDSNSNSSLKTGASVSELIEDIYTTEKLTELDIRLRYFFCALLKDSLLGISPYCDVLPFGSSVNGMGRHGCDLDVMIRMYPKKVNNDGEFYFLNRTCVGQIKVLQQRAIYCLGEYFRTFSPGVTSVQKILPARMPILKINHKILGMQCDVSVNNMSAVFMSDIIHYFGEIDPRVRPLLYAVKKWAKEAWITCEKPGSWITNFGLTTLVIYFLQSRPNPILPSLNDALVIKGEDNSCNFDLQYLKSIEECKSHASLNTESLAELLKEFFSFLAIYPFEKNILSLMTGKSRPHNDGVTLWIQYPFEEDLNITKNVSDYEFSKLAEKAKISAGHLKSNLNQKVNFAKDFSLLLGIDKLKKSDSKSHKLDVKSLFEDHSNNPKHKVVNHRAS